MIFTQSGSDGDSGRKRREQPFPDSSTTPTKICRRTDPFDFLPDEILVEIFSYLTHEQLFCNVRLACKKWKCLSASTSLWKRINAHKNIPIDMLLKWIRQSPLLEELSLCNRNDVDIVAETVSKYSKHLRKLKIEDCMGSKLNNNIRSQSLCNLVSKCKQLTYFHFTNVKIASYELFQLLFKHRIKSSSYYGHVNEEQMNALLEAIEISRIDDIFVQLKNIKNELQDFSDLQQFIIKFGRNVFGIDASN